MKSKDTTMNLPTLSIIMVTLNADAGLPATVASLLRQKDKRFNVVIKDGGSRIDPRTFFPENPGFEIIFNSRPDKSIYDAMNQATELAKGDYLLFLNAGDTLHNEESIAAFYGAVEKHGKLPAYFCHILFENNGKVYTIPKGLRFFLARNNICHQAQFLLREAIVSAGGFLPEYKVAADKALLYAVLVSNHWKAVTIPEVITRYQGNGFSDSEKSKRLREVERVSILKRYDPTMAVTMWFFDLITLRKLRLKVMHSGKESWLRRILVKVGRIVNK